MPTYSIDGPCEFEIQRVSDHGLENCNYDFDGVCEISVQHHHRPGLTRVRIIVDARAAMGGRPPKVTLSAVEKPTIVAGYAKPHEDEPRWVASRQRASFDCHPDRDDFDSVEVA